MEKTEGSIALLVTYFGTLPNYFPFWLRSAGDNASIDFLLFTDDRAAYPYPGNVIVTYMAFGEFCRRIQAKLDAPAVVCRPYKLCDFRPMYGFLFQEELKGYDYWGYCDVDLIFGNIRKFLTRDILLSYDKVFPRGHISIMRNNRDSAMMFQNSGRYREVMSDPENCTYDERFEDGINGVFLAQGKKIYQKQDMIADISIRHYAFHVNSDRRHVPSIFCYEGNGKTKGLYRYMAANFWGGDYEKGISIYPFAEAQDGYKGGGGNRAFPDCAKLFDRVWAGPYPEGFNPPLCKA